MDFGFLKWLIAVSAASIMSSKSTKSTIATITKPISSASQSLKAVSNKAVSASSQAPVKPEAGSKQVNMANNSSVEKKQVKKKGFFANIEYVALILLFVIVLFGHKGYALEISAPSSVVVNGSAVFFVDLINSTSSEEKVTLNFYSPAKVEIFAPSIIAPNSSVSTKITVHNNVSENESVSALVEAKTGALVVKKEVILELKNKEASSVGDYLSGLFSFGLFIQETSNFGSLDWVAFWVLVIIAAILVVAFASRLNRRV